MDTIINALSDNGIKNCFISPYQFHKNGAINLISKAKVLQMRCCARYFGNKEEHSQYLTGTNNDIYLTFKHPNKLVYVN